MIAMAKYVAEKHVMHVELVAQNSEIIYGEASSVSWYDAIFVYLPARY